METVETALVYDNKLWGPRDIANNEHCWRRATILKRYKDENDEGGRTLTDVRFHYDNHVSRGHLEHAIRKDDPTKTDDWSGSPFQDLKELRASFDSEKYLPYIEGESEYSYRERCAKWCEEKTGDPSIGLRIRATCPRCTEYKRLQKTTLEVARLLPKEMQASFSEVVQLVDDEVQRHFGAWGHHFDMEPE